MNKVQEHLVSDPIEVEGWEGTFRFKIPNAYEDVRILTRQQMLLGGLDPGKAGGAARTLAYVLSSLELLVVEAPPDFNLVEMTDRDSNRLTALYNALEDWRDKFRSDVQREQREVGEGGGDDV